MCTCREMGKTDFQSAIYGPIIVMRLTSVIIVLPVVKVGGILVYGRVI
jgi:hypothetical protein